MGDFSRLNKFIEDGERYIQQEKEAEINTLEDYFDERNKKRAMKTPIMGSSWEEANNLADVIAKELERKRNISIKKAAENTSKNPQELQREIIQVLSACVEKASQVRPDLIPSFKRLAQLFSQSKLGNVSEPEEDNNSSEKDYDAGVQKSCIAKSIVKECCGKIDIKNRVY